jgi:hypothetical protein
VAVPQAARVTKRKPPRKIAKPDERIVHQLEIHKVELQLQNEELLSSRSQAEDALERYRELFDFAPIGYATLEDIDTIVEINHCGAELLGIERARLIRQRFTVFVAAPSLSAFAHAIIPAVPQSW